VINEVIQRSYYDETYRSTVYWYVKFRVIIFRWMGAILDDLLKRQTFWKK